MNIKLSEEVVNRIVEIKTAALEAAAALRDAKAALEELEEKITLLNTHKEN